MAESLGVQGLTKRSSLWPIFRDLECADIIRMIGDLGLAAAGRGLGRSKRGPPRVREVAEYAAEILSDRPHGFHSFLTEADKKNDTLSLKRRFGWVYQRLLGQGHIALPMPMLESARAIVVPRAFPRDDRHDRWLNRKQTARRLNIHENSVTKMVREQRLSGRYENAGAKKILFIAADEVERLASVQGIDLDRDAFKTKFNALSFTEAARLAGVSIPHTEGLVKSGCVKTVVRFTSVFVLRNSIEDLIARIDCLVRPSGDETANLINVVRAVQIYKNLHIGVFLKSVLDEKISPIRINSRKRGLRRFLFDNADVEQFAQQLDSEEGFTARHAGQQSF